jgi:hypothetical protein
MTLWRCAALALVLAAGHVSAQLAREPDDVGDDGRQLRPTSGQQSRPNQAKLVQNQLSVELSGTGVQAKVTFSAPSPALFTAPANTKVKDGIITVTNSGTGPLTLSAAPAISKTAGAAASKFSITGGTCVSGKVVAAAGGTCTIAIRYTPANKADSTARVSLTTTGADDRSQSSASFRGN